MKQTAYVVGNCQVYPIFNILRMSENFSRFFEIKRFAPVHVAKAEEVEELHNRLSSTPLLVAQLVNEDYRNNIGLGTETLRSKLPPGARLISWPSLYFSAYNPELFYLKNDHGASVYDTFDYHILPVLRSYVSGEGINECISSYQASDFGTEISVDKAITQLELRERSLSVKSAEFIFNHFRSDRLFHTFNHPTSKVLLYVGGEILDQLGIPNDLPISLRCDPLSSTIYPITKLVSARLSLKFRDSESVLIRGVEQSLPFAVRSYYEFYDNNRRLVELNAARLGK